MQTERFAICFAIEQNHKSKFPSQLRIAKNCKLQTGKKVNKLHTINSESSRSDYLMYDLLLIYTPELQNRGVQERTPTPRKALKSFVAR